MPNLKDICEEYDLRRRGRNGSAPVEVNLSKVKVSAVKDTVTWRPVTTPRPLVQEDSAQKVTLTRNDPQSEAMGTLNTSKDFHWKTEVTIVSDVIKGLNQQLRLPLDSSLNGQLGNSILINIGQTSSNSEPIFPVNIQTAQSFQRGASANVAVVRQDHVNYSGEFTCTVALKGDVLFPLPNGVTTVDILELCQYFLDNNLGHRLSGLKVKRDTRKVTFELAGRVTFRGDHERIQWQ